jgi:hypothetical protein
MLRRLACFGTFISNLLSSGLNLHFPEKSGFGPSPAASAVVNKRNASCSPYRVPIARLAAAHAQINHPRN